MEIEYQRLKSLLEDRAIARQLFDNVNAGLAEAKARLATAREGLKLAHEGFRSEDIDAARADQRAAQARSAGARTRLEDTQCQAPNNGVILTRVEEPGAIVGAGQTVLTLSLDTPVWIRAYIEEPDLGRIHPGMVAQILTDSRPQQPYLGKIGYISPEAEFTPKTVQTEELRTRLVYQVRIIADTRDLEAGRAAQASFILDGRKTNAAQIVQGYALSIINRYRPAGRCQPGIAQLV